MHPIRLTLASFAITATLSAQQPHAAAAAPRTATASASGASRDDRAAEALGWRLGVQAWTFRDRTAFEAIDTAHALGLKYIELYPGQPLRPDNDAKVAVDMPEAQRDALRQKLAASQVQALAFGVVGFANDEAKAREVFAFAEAMGIRSISCEPEPDAWDLVERLADQYRIDVACHDHPKPSRYWNPETVLAAVAHRSQRLGACADTGHWPRSGLDPVASLALLAGRIRSLHFKDIAPADRTGVDQPWGTGAGKAHAMLAELDRQGFRGLFAIEYETGSGKELEANVARCIAFFDDEARAFAAQHQTPDHGAAR